MRTDHRERWDIEIRKQPLKRPTDLLRRSVSSEDFVDSAIIGGVSVADILAGKVAEWQIPSDVINAFHAQYPQYGSSFVQAVNHLAGSPEKLMGLVNGVKGKVFELDYANWLNHGHLPVGWSAELAHHANNPGWDIAIHDAYGHINDVLQLKATESLNYVREAISAHPNIDVVVPHELYAKLADHHDVLGHILDGHETLHHINGHVEGAIGHAEAADTAYHFPIFGPVLVIGMAAGLNYRSYRQGRVTPAEALRNVGERGALAVLASGAGWAAVLLTHATLVGIPVSMGTRLLAVQFFHNRKRRGLLTAYIETVVDSRRILVRHLHRPLLEAQA